MNLFLAQQALALCIRAKIRRDRGQANQKPFLLMIRGHIEMAFSRPAG
jgi:hypothetical protein